MLITQRVGALIKAALVMLAFLLVPQWAFADLVSFGAQWQYLDTGATPPPGWKNREFNDDAWSSGHGPLGYGDGDESTRISFGTNARKKHITTYFRHHFNASSVPSEPLRLNVKRDDGVVVYLNGLEVFRNNMPPGTVRSTTRALFKIRGTAESAIKSTTIASELLVIGANQIAVEIHQARASSSDISFDLQLTDSPVVRGPYLQQSSSTGITVRWRTKGARNSVLRYGTKPNSLNQIAKHEKQATDHAITLAGLKPDTRYYYGIGDSSRNYDANEDQFFDTHPVTGSPAATRIWVLGDSGTADSKAAAVSESFQQFNEGSHSDVWLMLGDNAYKSGTDKEYQAAVFDLYTKGLRNSVLWPTLGNHDGRSADSGSQSGVYYDIFTLPTQGESGGIASGTEAYYSFDYANIHFVSLDSHDTNRSAKGAMASWLENDLAANTQEWIIAFWHHPPYTKGSHDSDDEQRHIDMRKNFLPILEAHSVDLVLGGHSHTYERSMLIDGHYGLSKTFNNSHVLSRGDGSPAGDGAYEKLPGSHTGSVYSVAGSSGKISKAPLNHPVMISNLIELGSLIIDVQGSQLDATFLNSDSIVRDSFRIVHIAPSAAD